MKTFILVLFLFSSFSLYCFELAQARSQNKVCETKEGYLKALDPAVQADVDSINATRKGEYQKAADAVEPKQDVAAAAALMGTKLVEKYGTCK